MKHLVRNAAPLLMVAALTNGWTGCQTDSIGNEGSNTTSTAQAAGSLLTENTPVAITQAPGAALFIEQAVVDEILRDLDRYFVTQNEGNWDATLDFYPLHRSPMTEEMRQRTIEGMQDWWNKGLRNQTEAADLLYASESYRDGDQDIVLLNMDLVHRVIFVDFKEGNPSGMKGMVESSYGKGNAKFYTLEGTPKREYWEVRGDNRLWAVKAIDGDHWCFLPANFNERGGGQFMSVDAMTTLLKHRSENDPHRLN